MTSYQEIDSMDLKLFILYILKYNLFYSITLCILLSNLVCTEIIKLKNDFNSFTLNKA